MATAFVFTHARHASEAATLEAMRRDLLQRGRARFKSVLREEAKLRGAVPPHRPALAPLPFKARPLRGLTRPLAVDAAPTEPAAPTAPGASTSPEAPSRFMVHPLTRWKLWWDSWLLVLVLYSAVMVPWSVSFRQASCDAAGGDCASPTLTALDTAVDVCFWVDLALCFRTGFMDEHGGVHLGAREVARRYATSYFLVDLVSVFPFDAVARAALGAEAAARQALLLSLFKLPRLLRVGRLTKKLSALAAADGFRVAKLTLAFLILGHWVGCMWFFLARWQINNNQANQYTGNLAWTQGFPGGNWSYASADVRTQYTASLYWTLTTMTTVGYGDIVPLSNYERAFACVVELLGAVCTALVFGNVALLVQGLDGAGAAARERLAVLNEFAARHGLPAPLAARLRASAAHAAAAHGGVDAAAATAELPPSLRAEVLTHLQAGAVRSALLLRGCAPGLVDACVRSACLRLYLPGERVFEAGDPGRDIFFIARGAVKLTSPDGEAVYALLKAGEHFGEVEALGASARRGATAVAIAACELHALSRDALDAALCDYPEHCEQLRAAAAERAVALDAARVKCGVLDSDTPPGKEQGIITTADEIAPPAPPAELAAPGAGALAEAEAALDALLTWQSAQATALHRKLCALEEAQAGVARKVAALAAAQAKQPQRSNDDDDDAGSIAAASLSGVVASLKGALQSGAGRARAAMAPPAAEAAPAGRASSGV